MHLLPEAPKYTRSSGMAVLGAGIMPCRDSFDTLLGKTIMDASIDRARVMVMQISRGGVQFDLPRGCSGESTPSAIVRTRKNRLFLTEPGLFSILTV